MTLMKDKLQKLSTSAIDATNAYGDDTLDDQYVSSGESSRSITTDAPTTAERLVSTEEEIGKTAYEAEKEEKDTADLAEDV